MFKYRTKFTSVATISLDVEKDFHLSKASLDSLKSLIPSSVDLERNIDLVGVAFNAAVVNKFNKNHDGIDTSAALALSKYFNHKPTNIEHKRHRVVGHIVNAAFSKYGSNELLSDDELSGYVDPFNISLAAVVYKTVDKNFAKALTESCDSKSPLYQKISASWEIGFNDYYIALGSEDLKEAEIITDPVKIKELSKYLRRNEGAGAMDDGTIVRCLVTGKIYPLGIGFTTNPAADVRGVTLANDEEDDEKEEGEEKEDDMTSEKDEKEGKEEDDEKETEEGEEDEKECVEANTQTFLSFLKKKISQDKNNTVNINKSKLMDLEQIIDALKTALAEKQETVNFSDEAVASISSKIAEAIKIKDQEFKEQVAAAEAAKVQALADAEKFKADLEQAIARLNELESTAKAKAAQELYNTRMASLDEVYDFEDADRTILAKEVAGLDNTDESFASYKERIAILFKHKSKAYKAEQEKAFSARLEQELAKRGTKVSTASTDVDTALSNAKSTENDENKQSTLNPTEDQNKKLSWKERIAKSFSKENISIKY